MAELTSKQTGSQMFRVSPEEARSKAVNPSENFDTSDIDQRINAAAAQLDIKLEENTLNPAVEERLKAAKEARAKAEAEAKAAEERLERRARWRKAIIIAAVVAVVVLVLTK